MPRGCWPRELSLPPALVSVSPPMSANWIEAPSRQSHGFAFREKKRRNSLSQKIQKSWKTLLTVRSTPDYIRLNNEGGAPLATPEFASKEAALSPG
jgi:hypothetical protein